MIWRFVVISMMSNIKQGVETPWTIDDQTSAFIALMPEKFRDIPIAVNRAMAALKRFTSPGGK